MVGDPAFCVKNAELKPNILTKKVYKPQYV